MLRAAWLSILITGIGLCVLAFAPAGQTLMVDADITYRSDEEVFNEWEIENPQNLLQGVSKRQIQSLHEDETLSAIRVDRRSDTSISITFWYPDTQLERLREVAAEQDERISLELPAWVRFDLEVLNVDQHGLTIRHKMYWEGEHKIPDEDWDSKQPYLQMAVLLTANQFGYPDDVEVRIPEGFPPAQEDEEEVEEGSEAP